MSELSERYETLIDQLLDRKDTSKLVAEYLEPTSQYAGTTFDTVGSDPEPFAITHDDILAVSFLDTPIRASAFRILMQSQDRWTELLNGIKPELVLWETDSSGKDYRTADQLWHEILKIKGIGVTRVSKLLARKRPHLIPILDSRVRTFYEDQTEEFWQPLGQALKLESRRAAIDALRPPDGSGDELSTLRILDIAIWMTSRMGPPEPSSD